MTSIAIISCICGYLIIIPFDCVCRYDWLVLEYGISYFSLIIGISQVGTLPFDKRDDIVENGIKYQENTSMSRAGVECFRRVALC